MCVFFFKITKIRFIRTLLARNLWKQREQGHNKFMSIFLNYSIKSYVNQVLGFKAKSAAQSLDLQNAHWKAGWCWGWFDGRAAEENEKLGKLRDYFLCWLLQ